jgi:hypothetical protein
MELKEFSFEDESWPDWPDRYAVLFVDSQDPGDSDRYVINAGDSSASTTIYPAAIDHWLHMLTWVRAHWEQVQRDNQAAEAIKAGIAEPVQDPREFDDSEGVREEDG